MVSLCGKMAPPIFVFCQHGFQPFTIKEAEDILILATSTGRVAEEITFTFVLPHLLKYIEDDSLLIYDETSGHISPRIVDLLGTKLVDGMRIPNDLTSIISPIESFLKKKLLSSVQKSFANWCMKNYEQMLIQYLKKNKRYGIISNRLLAHWVLKACKQITKEDIVQSFSEVGLNSKDRQIIILQEVIPSLFSNRDNITELYKEEDEVSDS